jgi:hydroxyacyl-ACP dehydratase HTD2-like protein with hotdog domain
MASWSDPPQATWSPTLLDTVRYAAAMWEFQRLHFDPAWARSEGLAEPIVQGPLLGTKLSQLVDHWAVDHGGTLRQVRWRNVSQVAVDSDVTLSGRIVERPDDGTLVLELSLSSAAGDHVRGRAVVSVDAEAAS